MVELIALDFEAWWNVASLDLHASQVFQVLEPELPQGSKVIRQGVIPTKLVTTHLLQDLLSHQDEGCHKSEWIVFRSNHGQDSSSGKWIFFDDNSELKLVRGYAPLYAKGSFYVWFTQCHV